MLKACWECLAGDRAAQEDPYGTQINLLNGGTLRAPPWPESQVNNEKMFVIPKRLNNGDRIIVHGNMLQDRKTMTMSLMTGNDTPDSSNVVCQLEVNFRSDASEEYDQIYIKTIENGRDEVLNESSPMSGFFVGNGFEVSFLMRGDEFMNIYVESSFLEQIKLKHNIGNIRFLAVSGDVEKVNKLEFEFL